MATLTSWAQDVITCDLCDKAAQQFCNSCQVSLCESCIKKHRDELKSLPHDIVPFLDRKIKVVFPECQKHSGGTEAWIFGNNKTITRIDVHGAVRDTVPTTCLTWPDDISVTRGGELIYSDGNSRTVNIVRDGKSETLIIAPQGWTPWRLCCTGFGDILVHVYKGIGPQSKHKIIHYQGQNIKQEINNDGKGNSIFKDGQTSLFMSENINGDVCVSDCNADTVVVVDKTGRVRFRYDGTPARNKLLFGPRGISTDALSQIIVTDINNNCLHILDQNGQFLRCVDGCGLEKPFGLNVDSEERLWVRSLSTGTIKVIKYLEQP
uniref:Tripartite motif-containing protein 2-like n=1 Tax=Crassostrea virginica TaxID=6565 RepID=A0A8B8BWN8_CRAVI|nr:tripartite motif-containing protein 2-like [Crassostrea virginica]